MKPNSNVEYYQSVWTTNNINKLAKCYDNFKSTNDSIKEIIVKEEYN